MRPAVASHLASRPLGSTDSEWVLMQPFSERRLQTVALSRSRALAALLCLHVAPFGTPVEAKPRVLCGQERWRSSKALTYSKELIEELA